MAQQDPPRVFFAVAAEGDDEYVWSQLKMLPELFTAGPVAIRVGFFWGGRYALKSTLYGLGLDHKPLRVG